MSLAVAQPKMFQRQLAALGFTVPRLAGELNLSRSSMIRRFEDGNFYWREYDHAMRLATHLNPSFGWQNAPDWVGLPPYPEGSDTHPAACMIDVQRSLRELDQFLETVNPSDMTEEEREQLIRLLDKSVQNELRLKVALRPQN